MKIYWKGNFLMVTTLLINYVTPRTYESKTASGSWTTWIYPSGGGHYGNNEDKQWTVTANQPSLKVMVELELSVIEYSSACRYDSLKFYDSNWTLKRTFCGTNLNPNFCYTTTGRNAYIRWKSDGSVTKRGWTIRFKTSTYYSTVCNVPDTTTPPPTTTPDPNSLTAQLYSQTVQHPSGRSYYQNNERITWTIRAANSFNVVELLLKSVDIEETLACNYDKLNYLEETRLKKTICGYSVKQDDECYVSTSNSVSLSWITDNSVVKRGWKIEYRSGPRSSLCMQTTTTTTSTTTTTTPRPTASSSNVLIARSTPQILTHPVTGNYAANERRQWQIRTDDTGRKLQLKLTRASIEYNSLCGFDSLAIFEDGNLINPKRKFCGQLYTNIQPSSACYISEDGVVFLLWRTDVSVQSTGWQLEYVTVPSSAQGCSGTGFSSMGPTTELTRVSQTTPYPNTVLIATGSPTRLRDRQNSQMYYARNLHQTWEIRATDPTKRVKLRLVAANIEYSTMCTYDYLSIHEDFRYSTPTDRRRNYCGDLFTHISSSYACYISDDNIVFLTWNTDNSGYKFGWELEYELYSPGDAQCPTDNSVTWATSGWGASSGESDTLQKAAVAGIIAGIIFFIIIAIVIATAIHMNMKRKTRKVAAVHTTKPVPTVSHSVPPINTYNTSANNQNAAKQWNRAGTLTRVGSLAIRNMAVPPGKANQLPPLQSQDPSTTDKSKKKKTKKPKPDSVDPGIAHGTMNNNIPPGPPTYHPPGIQNNPAFPPGPFGPPTQAIRPPGPYGMPIVTNGMHMVPPVFQGVPPPPPQPPLGMNQMPPGPPASPQPFSFQPQIEPPGTIDPLDAPPSYSDATSNPAGLQSFRTDDLPEMPSLDPLYPTDRLGVPMPFNYTNP